ncbi:hypothetical protein JXB31_02465 [Candidatus Woesearchaeota archaeon]|nr:hypothetical protein [Candidatus Woesearchaeota archaeon]
MSKKGINRKILQKKRAMTNQTIIALIIGLAVLLSIMGFSYKLMKVHDDTKQAKMCKEAIRISSAVKVKGDDSFLRLFMNPGSLLDTGSDRQTSDVPCPVSYRELSGNPESVKRELANLMYTSWDMMHEGKLNLFSGESGEERYCILTHHISFKGVPKLEGFYSYLEQNEIPKPDDNRKYSEYLKCFNPTPELFLGPQLSAEDAIDTSQDYGIMFLYTKKGYMQKVWASFAGGKWGTVAGTASGVITAILMPEPFFSKATALIIIGQAIAGATTGSVGGYLSGSEKAADWQACILLFPYNEHSLKNLNCTYMPGVQGNR